MTGLQIASLLIVLAGLFGALNARFLKLPSSVGILIVSLFASLCLMGVDAFFPGLQISGKITEVVDQSHFSQTMLEGFLGLLLFAGALHINISDLKSQWRTVFVMTTVGVFIATSMFGLAAMWAFALPPAAALLFGAIIAPTDPVAVLGVLKETDLDPRIETQIAGESLLNDGISYVLYLALLGIALNQEATVSLNWSELAWLFLREAGGGFAVGLFVGWIGYHLIRQIDDFVVTVLITLGAAFGGYQLTIALHASAPIFAVVTGLFMGNIGTLHGMEQEARDRLSRFWELIDQLLTSVLFLMIGIEVFQIDFSETLPIYGAIAICMALVARFISVAIPITILNRFENFPLGVIPIMTWGGLRGGISVALALTLPPSDWRDTILTGTYMIVVFTIIVQGLTVGWVARRATDGSRLL
ncbi:MAG: sodium:proton antiporter [Pseudomonadota bacterium]